MFIANCVLFVIYFPDYIYLKLEIFFPSESKGSQECLNHAYHSHFLLTEFLIKYTHGTIGK